MADHDDIYDIYDEEFEIDPYIDIHIGTSVKDPLPDDYISTEYSPLNPRLLLSRPNPDAYFYSTGNETSARPSQPTLRTSEDRDINIKLGFAPSKPQSCSPPPSPQNVPRPLPPSISPPCPDTSSDIEIEIDIDIDINAKDVNGIIIQSPKVGTPSSSSSSSSGFETAPEGNGGVSDERETFVLDEDEVLGEAHEELMRQAQELGNGYEPETPPGYSERPLYSSEASPDPSEHSDEDGDEEENGDGDGDKSQGEDKESGSGSGSDTDSDEKGVEDEENQEKEIDVAELEANLDTYFAEQDSFVEAGVEQTFNQPGAERTGRGPARDDYTPRLPWKQFQDPDLLQLDLSPSPPVPAPSAQQDEPKQEGDTETQEPKKEGESSQCSEELTGRGAGKSLPGADCDSERNDIKQEKPDGENPDEESSGEDEFDEEHPDGESSDDSPDKETPEDSESEKESEEESENDHLVEDQEQEEPEQEDSGASNKEAGLPEPRDQLPNGVPGARQPTNWPAHLSRVPSNAPRYRVLPDYGAALGVLQHYPSPPVPPGVLQQPEQQADQRPNNQQGQEQNREKSPSLEISSPPEHSGAGPSSIYNFPLDPQLADYTGAERDIYGTDSSCSPQPNLLLNSGAPDLRPSSEDENENENDDDDDDVELEPEPAQPAWDRRHWRPSVREPYNPPLNPHYPFSFDTSTIPNSSQAPEQDPEQDYGDYQDDELEEEPEEADESESAPEQDERAIRDVKRRKQDDPEYKPREAEQEQERHDQREEERAAQETVPEQDESTVRDPRRQKEDDPEYKLGDAEREQEGEDQLEEKLAAEGAVPEQQAQSEHGAEPEDEAEDQGQGQESVQEQLTPQSEPEKAPEEEEKAEEEKKGEREEQDDEEGERQVNPSPPPTQKRKRSSSSPSKRQNTGRSTRTPTQPQPPASSGNAQRRSSNRLRSRAATRATTTETVATAASTTTLRGQKRKATSSAESPSKKQKTDKEPRKKLNNAPTKPVAVYVFGSNSLGQLGLGHHQASITRPTLNTKLMQDAVGVVEVAAGGAHCIALTADNKVLTWGANDDGQLGRKTRKDDGSDADSVLNQEETEPMEVDFSHSNFPEDTLVVQVVATESASFVLTEFGDVFGWGTFRETYTNPDDMEKTIDIGFRPSIDIQRVPMHIPELTNVRRLAVGSQHVLAHAVETIKSRVKDDEAENTDSESSKSKPKLKGKGTRRTRASPAKGKRAKTTTRKPNKTEQKDSSTDTGSDFEEKVKSHVYAWGACQRDELGRKMVARQRSNASCLIPRRCVIPGLAKNIVDIASIGAGKYHSFITKLDGSVYAWGFNRFGQTGVVDRVELLRFDSTVEVPTAVASLSLEGQAVYTITGGRDHSLALTADGRCLSWGAIHQNGNRPLGVPKPNMSSDELIYPKGEDTSVILGTPTPIFGVEGNVVRITSGPNHSIAVTKKGIAYAWGSNSEFETGLPHSNIVATGGDIVELPTALLGGALKGRTVVGATAGDGFSVLLVDA
ncbi:uncharacterized protein BDV17DRAFT_293682 [Aspergillus undulatus]|uniref:uncharacterized protein n=1 Tax=Aspergillus undulatus TaxID=1810928 RepID=UPI003CCCFAB8